MFETGNAKEVKIHLKLYEAVHTALMVEVNTELKGKTPATIDNCDGDLINSKLSNIKRHLKKEIADAIVMFNDKQDMGKLNEFITTIEEHFNITLAEDCLP
ncbi:hypothetical protein HK096_003486 [Nowakowskiella sp. JEL0078]|nr:hypothetical protein HK096_003486 [Nowakowskiella sp. JEL0078]